MKKERASVVLLIGSIVFSNWPLSVCAAELFGAWRWEVGFYGGVLVADTVVGRDQNKTGAPREDLIGTLESGGLFGGRFGVHSDVLGFDANVAGGSERVEVANDTGVGFPNHGEVPLFFSLDASIYPFRRALLDGRLRPYLIGGVGAVLLSIDLDNLNDKEDRFVPAWSVGGGVKYLFGDDEGLLLDLQFRNHHVLNSGVIDEFDVQSITFGIGYRF